MKTCSVKDCLSRVDGKRQFFFFPRRTRKKCKVFQQWVEFCQDETLTKLTGQLKRWICDRHFRPQDFVKPFRLGYMAIPSLCGPTPKLPKISELPATVQDQFTSGIAEASEAVDTSATIIPSKSTFVPPSSDTYSLVPSTSGFPVTSASTPKRRVSSSILSSDKTLEDPLSHYGIPFEHSYASQGKFDSPSGEGVDLPDSSFRSDSLALKNICESRVSQLRMPRKRLLYEMSLAKKKKNELRILSKKYRKIKVQLHELFDSKNSITAAFESLSKHITAVSVIFLSSYLKSSSKKPKGKNWTLEEKISALSFYKRNPRAYSLMSNFFALPNKKTLAQLVKNPPFTSGNDDQICTTLSQHIEQMNKSERMKGVNVTETNVYSDICVETYSISEHTELKRIPMTSHTSVLIMTSDDNNSLLESVRGKMKSTGGLVENYCRICAAKIELTKLISIFDENGRQLDLLNKISKHLQIDVDRDEPLPLQVCTNCIRKLNICEELWQTCQKSDVKLHRMFKSKNVDEMKSFPEEPPVVVSSLSSNNEVEFPDDEKHEHSKIFSDNREGGESTEKLGRIENKYAVLCDSCGKWFKNMANLRCHKRTHLDDSVRKKHACTQCTKAFISKFRLSEHMNIHKGVRPYSCTECGKTFYKRQHVKQHCQIHIADNDKVTCEICDKKFCRKSNLRKHTRRHYQNRKYKCRICGDEFALLNVMLSHRKMHTQQDIKQNIEEGNNIEENIFTCGICGEILLKKSSLLLHLRMHREADSSSECTLKWSCTVCGKQLASRASLQYHIKSQHSDERPWHCQYCAERFMAKESLVAHEHIHTGWTPFKCKICDKGFHTESKLNQHMLKHSENRNFHCPDCGKRFRRKGSLTIHMRIHTGERPFICDLCERPFIRKNDMLKHQRTHIFCPQFSCDICGLLFDAQKELIDHKELNHGSEMDIDILPTVFASNNEIFGNVTHVIIEEGRKILLSSAESFEENAATV